jgi:hypothetical protein
MIKFLTKQKEYLKWLFRKPQISFNRKPSGKEVIKLIKEQNLYELGKLLPQFRLGKKRLSRLQSLLLLGGGIGLGVLASVFLGSPLPFLVGLVISYGSVYEFNAAATTYISCSALDSTHFVVAYQDQSASAHGQAIIGVVSNDDDIAYGDIYEFEATGSAIYISVSALDSTHFVVAWDAWGGSRHGQAKIGTVSNGDDIAYGNQYEFNATYTYAIQVSVLSSTSFVIVFADGTNDNHGQAIIGVVSGGNQITYGSIYEFTATGVNTSLSVSCLDSTHFVVAYRDNGDTAHGKAIVGVVSGTPSDDISYGSVYEFYANTTVYVSVASLDSTHFVVAYQNVDTHGYAIIGTTSGTPADDITFGDAYEFNNAVTTYISVTKIDSTHFVIAYSDQTLYGQAIIGTVSNVDEIAYGSVAKFNNARSDYISCSNLDSTHFVVAYQDQSASAHGQAIIGINPPPVTTNIKSYNTNLTANVKTINTNVIANVKSLNTNV